MTSFFVGFPPTHLPNTLWIYANWCCGCSHRNRLTHFLMVIIYLNNPSYTPLDYFSAVHSLHSTLIYRTNMVCPDSACTWLGGGSAEIILSRIVFASSKLISFDSIVFISNLDKIREFVAFSA